MSEDFADNALLIFQAEHARKLGAIFDQRFLRVGCFTVKEAHRADQLFPGLAMRAAVLSGIDSGEFPFLLARKRLDSLRQIRGQGFQFLRCALGSARLP